MKEVVYVDTDPVCAPGAINGEPTLICTEYIIYHNDNNFYYTQIMYIKKGVNLAELEKINGDVEEFAWKHGLEQIDPVGLDEYLNKLKSLFGQ